MRASLHGEMRPALDFVLGDSFSRTDSWKIFNDAEQRAIIEDLTRNKRSSNDVDQTAFNRRKYPRSADYCVCKVSYRIIPNKSIEYSFKDVALSKDKENTEVNIGAACANCRAKLSASLRTSASWKRRKVELMWLFLV